MNIGKMMKQAQQMQSKMAAAQEKLASLTVDGTAGGGKVTVTATGAGDITAIKIDPAVVDPEDTEMLEDLILSGIKNATDQAKAIAAEEMGKATGGLGGALGGAGLPGF